MKWNPYASFVLDISLLTRKRNPGATLQVGISSPMGSGEGMDVKSRKYDRHLQMKYIDCISSFVKFRRLYFFQKNTVDVPCLEKYLKTCNFHYFYK